MEEEVGASRRQRPLASALAVPACGLAFGVTYTAGALQLPAGSLAAPATGLFPLLVGGLLVASSLFALISEWRHPSVRAEPLGPLAWRIPVLFAALAAGAFLLSSAGFVIVGAVLCALVIAVAGKRRAWSVVLIACAISGLTAVAFALLGVPLPGVPL